MLRAFLIILIFCNFSSLKHDFHTSLTEINFNPKSKSLELSVRVFTDDLETALTNFNKGKLVRMEDPESEVDPLIEQYIRKNLALVSPEKEVKFGKFYGKEKESEATWIYLEIFDCQEIKGFTLYNAIMQELFEDQTNLVNIIYPSQKKTVVYNTKTRISTWPF
ncbi:hypothetical protein EGI22_02310 [Lacihabitans sp. LS3-19]|uniref:penicillin-binding protein activator LpoB n=1 Tax=Lacihabitans sp. LS3-19 TaxID=2487335 RepID=UPI0020CE1279|nr:penicillin-binding protein activator LpoB [Lacihabitans sp. LS3-19]MCP9766725.1 hypothetical protein [Lacihabitans sp. LS3-19]